LRSLSLKNWDYYENGVLRRQYSKDSLDSTVDICKEYYSDGKLKIVSKSCFGPKHGPTIEYYENGTIKSTAFYSFGKLNGELIEYDAKGNISSRTVYKDGVQIQ
jgi:antitoxin component YwqK of YwqJK toxin-antitoxin module